MRLFLVILLGLIAVPATHAYTGPGLGLGLIGTILGVVFSLLLAVLAFFWYPLKRMFKGEDDATEEIVEASSETEKPANPGDL